MRRCAAADRRPARLPAKRATAAQLAAMEGVWAKHDMVSRISADPDDPQVAHVLGADGGSDWTPLWTGIRLRTDGRFHAAKNVDSFTHRHGRRPALPRIPLRRRQRLLPQRSAVRSRELKPQADLRPPGGRASATIWVAANGRPDSTLYTAASGARAADRRDPRLDRLGHGEHPGQLRAAARGPDGQRQRRLHVPADPRRGLARPRRTPSSRGTAPRSGSGGAPPSTVRWTPWRRSPPARTRCRFDADAHTEWRTVTAASTLQIAGGGTWYLYDADFAVLDGGTASPVTVSAPAGSYLALFGPAGSSRTVTVTAR